MILKWNYHEDFVNRTTELVDLIGLSFETWEKTALMETIKYTGGRFDKAMKLLKMSERTFYRRCQKYGIRKRSGNNNFI